MTKTTATLDPQAKSINNLVFLLLFVLPFVIAPFGITQFENPKVILAEAGIITLLLLSWLRNQVTFRVHDIATWLYSALFILTLLQLLLFKTPLSFFGNDFRMQGIFLFWLLLIFSYLSHTHPLKNKPLWVFALLIVAHLIITFFLPINENGRYVGTMGEPNASAANLLFLWPFLWFSPAISPKTGRLKIISLVTPLAILFLYHSRSALIGFTIQVLFLSLQQIKVSVTKSTLISVGFILVSLGLPFIKQEFSHESRSEVWIAAFHAGLKNPIFGGGFGNTELLIGNSAKELDLPVQYSYVDSGHNIFLDFWVQGGIIGLSLLGFVVAFAVKSAVHNRQIRNITLL